MHKGTSIISIVSNSIVVTDRLPQIIFGRRWDRTQINLKTLSLFVKRQFLWCLHLKIDFWLKKMNQDIQLPIQFIFLYY